MGAKRNKRQKRKGGQGIFPLSFYIILGIVLVALFAIWWLPSQIIRPGYDDFRETGQIGDTIGGILGPIIASIAAILTFIAFWVQYRANLIQRDDIALERFENNLFQMISQQENITNALSFPHYERDEEVNISGRPIFEYIYHRRMMDWHKGLRHTIEMDGVEGLKRDKSLWCLDHYFRHLYRIFKYIDESPVLDDEDQKYGYTSIVRSSLSEYELILIFYNVLAFKRFGKFRLLIERYAIFNNLRIEHLATESERRYYGSMVFGGVTSEEQDVKYSKKAFIREQ